MPWSSKVSSTEQGMPIPEGMCVATGSEDDSRSEVVRWLEAERERNEKRYFRQWGFNSCMAGLGIVSLALALNSTVNLSEVQMIQLLGLSLMAFALGGLLLGLSPWIHVPKKG